MRSFRPALAVLPFALLAACSGEPEVAAPEGPDTNLTEEMPVEPLPTPEPLPEPTPSPTPTFDAAPAPRVAEDEQMIDDADATGMTARVDRSGGASNDAQPADRE